jgi:hypothetical protein
MQPGQLSALRLKNKFVGGWHGGTPLGCRDCMRVVAIGGMTRLGERLVFKRAYVFATYGVAALYLFLSSFVE